MLVQLACSESDTAVEVTAGGSTEVTISVAAAAVVVGGGGGSDVVGPVTEEAGAAPLGALVCSSSLLSKLSTPSLSDEDSSTAFWASSVVRVSPTCGGDGMKTSLESAIAFVLTCLLLLPGSDLLVRRWSGMLSSSLSSSLVH